MGLRAVIRAKKRFRHVSGMSDEQVPNVLERDFCATAPNQKWATDVTEFNVHGNKLYLLACMDFSTARSSLTKWPDVPFASWLPALCRKFKSGAIQYKFFADITNTTQSLQGRSIPHLKRQVGIRLKRFTGSCEPDSFSSTKPTRSKAAD